MFRKVCCFNEHTREREREKWFLIDSMTIGLVINDWVVNYRQAKALMFSKWGGSEK